MRISIYQTNGHGQHSQPSTNGQPHISRKMEDHVHDTKYKNSCEINSFN